MAWRPPSDALYVTCPYDPNHKLAPRRLAYHLDKCARTSKKILSICKYNSLHRIEPVLLEHHYTECPDKRHYDDGWGDDADLPPATKSTPKLTGAVDDLADALGAAAISDSKVKPSPSTSASVDTWDVGERKNYLAPEFDGTDIFKASDSFSSNKIKVQNMTKSQRKQFYKELLANNLAVIEKQKKEREIAEKKMEMEKSRQQELEEKAAIEKEKLEKEEKRREIAKKKKALKERTKAIAREAYLAKIEQEKQTNNMNHPEVEP